MNELDVIISKLNFQWETSSQKPAVNLAKASCSDVNRWLYRFVTVFSYFFLIYMV